MLKIDTSADNFNILAFATTLSNANLTVNGEKVDPNSIGINTDIEKAQVITKDDRVDMIDVNLQTDLANKKERDKIRDAKDKVGDVVKTVENVIDKRNIGGIEENYVNNRFATRGVNAVEDDPKLSKALENFESLSPEQKYSVMLKVAETMYKANGFSDAPDIIITEEKTTQRGKDTGVIYVNLEQLSSFSAGDLVNIIAHESSHSEILGESEENFAIEKGNRAKEKFDSPKDTENIDLIGYLSTLEDEYRKEKIRLVEVKEKLPEEVGEPFLSFVLASDTLAEPSEVNRNEITFKKNGKAYYKGQEVKVIYTLTSSGIKDKVTIEPVENNKILDLIYGEIGGKVGGKILSKLGKGISKLTGKTTVDINKLNHIFGKESHNLSGFLKKYNGDQIKAYKALELAIKKYVDLNKVTGTFKDICVNVNGVNITVRGAVVKGQVKIGTAFIP